MGEHVNVNGSVELTMGDRMNLVTFALAPEDGLVDAAGDRVSGAALSAVLRSIAGFADGYGVAFPSYGRLSGMTRLGRRTIQRAMECLEQAGILVLIGRKRRVDGTLGTAEWRLDWAALAAWVPENERRRIPQQVVDLIATAHRPIAMVARGEDGDQAPPEAHPSATSGTHQAPSDGAAEPSEEPSENRQQQQEAENPDAAAGSDARGDGDTPHTSTDDGGRPLPQGERLEEPEAESESDAVRRREVREVLLGVRQGHQRITEPTLTELELRVELDGLTARQVIDAWKGKPGKGVGALISDLRSAVRDERIAPKSVQRSQPGPMSPRDRSRIIRELAEVIAARITIRAGKGKAVDEEAMYRVHEGHVKSDARKCGVIDDAGLVEFWSEVWAAVVDGGELNAECAESAEKNRRVG